MRYNAGKLQLSGEWEQFSEGVEGSASVPEKIEKCGEKDDEEEDCEEDTQYEDYEVLQGQKYDNLMLMFSIFSLSNAQF